MNTETFSINDRHAEICARIKVAAEASGRKFEDIVFTAVSKVQPPERVDAALRLGHRVFGENRVQEAQDRWIKRRTEFADLHLRLIGPLQSNKSKNAVELFDAIETLDRPKLARKIADAMEETGRTLELFVQINTGEETQKAGVSPSESDCFIASLQKDFGLSIKGVMCIPPVDEPAAPHFALLKRIADRNGLPFVSAGMSNDFELAVRMGATHVRIGSSLFGDRTTSPVK